MVVEKVVAEETVGAEDPQAIQAPVATGRAPQGTIPVVIGEMLHQKESKRTQVRLV